MTQSSYCTRCILKWVVKFSYAVWVVIYGGQTPQNILYLTKEVSTCNLFDLIKCLVCQSTHKAHTWLSLVRATWFFDYRYSLMAKQKPPWFSRLMSWSESLTSFELKFVINQFYATGLFLYLLKTLENRWFSDSFRG